MGKTYKIGEAAALLKLKSYVLRFWETEFPDILPLRTDKGQRLYTSGHLALLERIRFLLHEKGLTIEGARKALAEEKIAGLRYVFGVPGALPPEDIPPAATGPDGAGPNETGPDEPDSGDDVDGLDGADADPSTPERGGEPLGDENGQAADAPEPGDEDGPPDPQYNLPGLPRPPRPRKKEEDEAPPVLDPPGSLPLFAVAAAAGRLSGGANFIQPAPAVTDRQAPPETRTSPPPASGPADDGMAALLRDTARELSSIAALLRGAQGDA